MRRTAPRSLAHALAEAMSGAAPPTLLARAQGCWPEVVGPAVAAEAEPAGERSGVLTVACRSAVWAQELELLSSDLLERLNAILDPVGGRPLVELRFDARAGRFDAT